LSEGLTAEQIRAEVARRNEGRCRRKPAPAAEIPKAPDVPGGSVRQTLVQCEAAVCGVEAWLDHRDWTASRCTAAQRAALDRLYAAASVLHQRLIEIRARLRQPEPDPAEVLQGAGTRPF
jgi:hypothetical protein